MVDKQTSGILVAVEQDFKYCSTATAPSNPAQKFFS
jgi:hypothetical protein